MQIKFDVFWKKNLGSLYKDNSIDVLGKEAIANLDLREVSNIYVNFKVNDKSFTDLVEIVDIETSLIRIPFKTDVIKLGTNELELVATMKNGDVKPSQTFAYTVDKSLENPNAVEADTNYPVLIELLNLTGNKLIDMDKSIQKVNTSIENMTNEISNYKEATTKELENNFNNYSSNTTLNINKVLDNKIVEVDNVVSIKSNELDAKFAAKSNEITKTLNDEITKVDEALDTTVTTINTELDKKSKEVDNKVNAKIVEIDNRVNAKITDVDTSLNNKINEVNEVIEEVELSEQTRKEEHTELVEELSSYSSDLNNVKDRVDALESKITDNEVIVDLKNKVNNHEERIITSEKTIRHQGILLNALNDLDDTISIEEEGTIISLPQSDNGKIIIDELQGNTLVNYCTDGSEELTLNNEIDIQGTDITLTDTVDNGKVDVVCEGNTLVNLMPNIDYSSPNANDGTQLNYFSQVFPLIQNNKTYTIIFNNYCFTEFYLSSLGLNWINIVNKNIFTFTTSADNSTFDNSSPRNFMLKTTRELTSAELMNLNFIILEGDYTNKPIPSYFEGMKSVGECEDNKIEILSQGKNLFDKNSDINFISNTGNNFDSYKQVEYDYIRFKYGGYGIGVYFTSNINKLPKGTYTLSCECYCGSENSSKDINIGYRANNSNRPTSIYKLNSYNTWEKKNHTFTISEETDIEGLIIQSSGSSQNYKDIDFRIKNIQLERNAQSTDYIPYALNKKEIQLSEPLRGLPNGIKDKFVKQGGKWYVERNCGEVVLDGSNDEIWNKDASAITKDVTVNFYVQIYDKNGVQGSFNVLCDKLPTGNVYTKDIEGIYQNANTFHIGINKSKLSTQDVSGFRQWLQQNPLKIVYELATSTYEEITDPQVITYLDTTHISTNSTIPCNMQVKNSGYDTIIKPSTLYTVAFDTDKSGKVNIALGGAKTSTTNNVATITTPSTLTDDSLTLYGKGVKANSVRLLEGDKTNYIPSFFEGMKSCFEDKEQEDGSYEVEIISNNENLFDTNNIIKDYYWLSDGGHNFYKGAFLSETFVVVKEGMVLSSNAEQGSVQYMTYDQNKNLIERVNASNFTVPSGVSYMRFSFYNSNLPYGEGKIAIGNNVGNYTPHKSNSIQLKLNEPLRAVGDVKDRFVLRDGKLMIERNCRKTLLDGSSDEGWYIPNDPLNNGGIHYLRCNIIIPNDGMSNKKGIADKVEVVSGSQHTLTKYNQLSINSSKLYSNCLYISFKGTLNELKQWLSINPITLVYQLAEPTYEEVPYETQKLILECFENGTLFIDTLIPPTVSVTYSANKPVVEKLNQVDNTTNINTEDIAITQMAVDFLLMSSLGEEMINFKIKGGTNMSAYFASRIIKGALKYEDVISKYPNYKEDIDLILIAEGYSDLIVEL